MTADLICFGFRTGEDGSTVEGHEEMRGDDEFLKVLESRYGIKPVHGFQKVAFPAFTPNLTSLWGKPYRYQ